MPTHSASSGPRHIGAPLLFKNIQEDAERAKNSQDNLNEEQLEEIRQLRTTIATSTFSAFLLIGIFCGGLYFCCHGKRKKGRRRIKGRTYNTSPGQQDQSVGESQGAAYMINNPFVERVLFWNNGTDGQMMNYGQDNNAAYYFHANNNKEGGWKGQKIATGGKTPPVQVATLNDANNTYRNMDAAVIQTDDNHPQQPAFNPSY